MERKRLERGLVQIYTGKGKGKTCSAFGQALRAVGHGLRVYIVQFLKKSSKQKGFEHGELPIIKNIENLHIKQFGTVQSLSMTDSMKDVMKKNAQNALSFSQKILISEKYDVIILDEINETMQMGLLSVENVNKMIDSKPSHVELILTGRNAPEEILKRADLVTEFKDVKHPYKNGFESREGIEY